jgi:hypothetical protein
LDGVPSYSTLERNLRVRRGSRISASSNWHLGIKWSENGWTKLDKMMVDSNIYIRTIRLSLEFVVERMNTT